MLFDEIYMPAPSKTNRRRKAMPPQTTNLPRKQKYRGHVRSSRRDARKKIRYADDRAYERSMREEGCGIFYGNYW